MRASRSGHARVVEFLLAAGGNKDLNDTVSLPQGERTTPNAYTCTITGVSFR
jgi:hypothetical protein